MTGHVFECPGCGKDIADHDQPHADNCEWELAHNVETIILRRLHDNRVAGYTLEMSREIAALLHDNCQGDI